HNNEKVDAGTEPGRQEDAGDSGIIRESDCQEPPAASRRADSADQLPAYSPDHERGTDADRAPGIADRGHGDEQAGHDDGHGDPGGAEWQAPENRDELDNGRDNSPIAPALRPADGKMQPALRGLDNLENTAQGKNAQEQPGRAPFLAQQDYCQVLGRHRQD